MHSEICIQPEYSFDLILESLCESSGFHVVYDQWGSGGAVALECFLCESGMGGSLLSDMESFWHGRYFDCVGSNARNLILIGANGPHWNSYSEKVFESMKGQVIDLRIGSVDMTGLEIHLALNSIRFLYRLFSKFEIEWKSREIPLWASEVFNLKNTENICSSYKFHRDKD